jgi:transcriptional regulator
MYQPPAFREDRIEVQHDLIRAHPLALVVTAGPGGLMANSIPFLVDAGGSTNGTLRGHLARANPQWRELAAVDECLVVFQGPQEYITPSWYATKRETGKVVPTWNYAVVHAYGIMRVMDDEAWLRTQIGDLTRFNEAARTAPWAVTDAPKTFVDAMVRGIIGLEIEIARIEGKWKVSQNRPEADREGVVEGLRAEADERADAMAELVEAFGAKGKARRPTRRIVAATPPGASSLATPPHRRRPARPATR